MLPVDISNIRNRLEEKCCLWTLAPTATQRKGEGGYANCRLQKLEHTCCCKDLTQCSSHHSSTRKSCRSMVHQCWSSTGSHFPACNPWSQSAGTPKAASSHQLPPSAEHEASQNVLHTPPNASTKNAAGQLGCRQVQPFGVGNLISCCCSMVRGHRAATC